MEEPTADFRRLHPLTFVHYVFLGVVGFGIAWLSSGGEMGMRTYSLIFSIIYTVFAGPYVIAKYIRFRYHATSEELIIYYGVFQRIRRNIPADRIQNVAIKRNMLSRILGTAVVRVETAGSASAEGVLSYVGIQEAERLRSLFQSLQSADQPEETSAALPGFRMPVRRVLLSSIYQFSLGLFALLIGLYFQLDSLGIVDTTEVVDWLIEEDFFWGRIENSWLLLGFVALLITLVSGWALGFIQNLIRYYNFRMVLAPLKIQRRFGLLTIREGALPYKRVQSFLIRSNPFMRLRHWHRLDLQTLGLQSGEQGFQPAMPFAKWSEIIALAPQIRPFTLPETYTDVSPLTIRRHSLRYSALITIASIILSQVWSLSALWGFALLPVGWGFAWLQYRCHHWAFHDGNLLIRRRVFSQQFWIIPVERFQAFELSATFFQRRLGLCSLIVDTAGAGGVRYPKIIDLKREDAIQLFERLYGSFQGQLGHQRITSI